MLVPVPTLMTFCLNEVTMESVRTFVCVVLMNSSTYFCLAMYHVYTILRVQDGCETHSRHMIDTQEFIHSDPMADENECTICNDIMTPCQVTLQISKFIFIPVPLLILGQVNVVKLELVNLIVSGLQKFRNIIVHIYVPHIYDTYIVGGL